MQNLFQTEKLACGRIQTRLLYSQARSLRVTVRVRCFACLSTVQVVTLPFWVMTVVEEGYRKNVGVWAGMAVIQRIQRTTGFNEVKEEMDWKEEPRAKLLRFQVGGECFFFSMVQINHLGKTKQNKTQNNAYKSFIHKNKRRRAWIYAHTHTHTHTQCLTTSTMRTLSLPSISEKLWSDSLWSHSISPTLRKVERLAYPSYPSWTITPAKTATEDHTISKIIVALAALGDSSSVEVVILVLAVVAADVSECGWH